MRCIHGVHSLACQFLNVPRLIFAMGERGDFPHFVARTSSRHNTPGTMLPKLESQLVPHVKAGDRS